MQHKYQIRDIEKQIRTETAIEVDRCLLRPAVLVCSFLQDPEQMMRAFAGLSALMLAGFTARETTKLARQRLLAVLGRPSLVRETSRLSALKPFAALRTLKERAEQGSIKDAFQDVVLHPDIQNRVVSLAEATRNTRANHAPFRHVYVHSLVTCCIPIAVAPLPGSFCLTHYVRYLYVKLTLVLALVLHCLVVHVLPCLIIYV